MNKLFRAVFGAVLLLSGGPAAAWAQRGDVEKPTAEMLNTAAQRAIDKGLGWVAGQQAEDGGFGSGAYRSNVAVISLCGMAFLAGGSTPGRGRYGEPVQRAVDTVLANAQPSGFIVESGSTSHGPMYGHGFSTLFLAEVYGMSPRADLREKLSRAVRLIVNTQNAEGGWRYYPKRDDADISVTVCEVMALRGARNAGLFVPNETIDRAPAYVKRCQNADGGFMYQASVGGESAFPRSAAAVVALHSAGIYEGPEIRKALDYVMQFLPSEDASRKEAYYEYGHYYAAQAMWQAGGQRWARWYPAVRNDWIARQRADGSWTSAYGTACATAMGLLVLQMPDNQLPIFQR